MKQNKFFTNKAWVGLRTLCLVLACMTLTACGDFSESATNAEDSSEIATEISQSETKEEDLLAEEIDSSQVSLAQEVTAKAVNAQTQPSTEVTFTVADIPEYSGNPYVEINHNIPQFLETDLTTSSYEYYSELDNLGRCGVVYACIGTDLMPTEERGEIGSVKPTGWQTIKYDVVDGKYLYNRCHLIGFQLSGENANTKNLITGTRYMNVEGMLPFENMVADYVKETGNHVMYRVTPIFEGDNLLANGVQMEAESVEDNGEGILFNVYCYNVQPEIAIDYATGASSYEGMQAAAAATESAKTENQEEENDNEFYIQSIEEPASDTNNTDNTLMVWVSATGDKYHSINHCGRMNPDKARQMTEAEALAQGLGKCSKCW